MRDLPLGLFVVERADCAGIEIFVQLRQWMVRTLEQPQVAAVRVAGEESMQETGLVDDAFGPPMNKQETLAARRRLPSAT